MFRLWLCTEQHHYDDKLLHEREQEFNISVAGYFLSFVWLAVLILTVSMTERKETKTERQDRLREVVKNIKLKEGLNLKTLENNYRHLEFATQDPSFLYIIDAYAEFMENNFGVDFNEAFEFAEEEYITDGLDLFLFKEVSIAKNIVKSRIDFLRKNR